MNRSLGLALGVIGLVVVGALVYFFVLRGSAPVAESTPPPSPTATVAATATEEPLDAELLGRRVTVLILGRDMDEWRRQNNLEHNTDAIMVVSVNASHDEVAMVSIPRDTVDFPLAGGEIWPGKLNAVTRELGFDEMVGAVESLLEIEIDWYAQIDMDDLVRLVDAVGGVDVSTPTEILDPGLNFYLPAGDHHLDGVQALFYSQSRQDGDHARSARQQEVLLGIVQSIADPETDLDVLELVRGLASLETDIPLDKVPTLLEISRQSLDAEVTRQVLAPPEFALFEGDEGTGRGWVLIPNIDAMRAYVAEVMGD